MTENETEIPQKTEPAGFVNTAVNIITAPSEAFTELRQRPTKILPLVLIMGVTSLVMFWYFSILDFDWFIDDTLSQGTATEAQTEAAREAMQSLSQRTFMMFGILGSVVGLLVINVLQAGYLSLAAALSGNSYKFTHWFSLVIWAGLPYLLSVTGMVVTILLSPNGQLSAYDLDPLTLANLGMQTENSLMQQLLNTINLPMLWSLALVVMAHRQWTGSGLIKAVAIVGGPYLLIFGAWAYFALS